MLPLLSSLLVCVQCRLRISNPVTLRCGHSICAAHAPRVCPRCSAHPPPTRTHAVVEVGAETPPADVPIPQAATDITLSAILGLFERAQSSLRDLAEPEDDDDDPRPRKRPRNTDGDLLSHLRNVAEEQRADTTRESILQDLNKELLSELTCQICTILFYEPLTTPCQHSFCARCLYRSLDHNENCPLCRASLPGFHFFQTQAFNEVILSIIIKAYPELYEERKQAVVEEELQAKLKTPIIEAMLVAYSGVNLVVKLREPKYRLMLRRALDIDRPHFGLILPARPGSPQPSAYGNLMGIRRITIQNDGVAVVEVVGTTRFRVIETGSLDGYTVAHIEQFSDVVEGPSAELMYEDPRSAEDLKQICIGFLERCRRGATPWVVARARDTYGIDPPEDPTVFAFWVSSFLPVDEQELNKLLPIRSPRLRLIVVVHWIEQLSSTWWFGHGCNVL